MPNTQKAAKPSERAYFLKATSGTAFQLVQERLGIPSENRQKRRCKRDKEHRVFPVTPEQVREARKAADNVGHITFDFFFQPPGRDSLMEPLVSRELAAV